MQAVPFSRLAKIYTPHGWSRQRALHPSRCSFATLSKNQAYSWSKAPRLAGEQVETGALARQLVNGQPLKFYSLGTAIGRQCAKSYSGAFIRIGVNRAAMEQWLKQIRPQALLLSSGFITWGAGVGLVEAARGSLEGIG